MTLKVHGICYYRSNSDGWTEKWSKQDYNALNLVKAIKGKSFNGYTDFKVNGVNLTIRDNAQGRGVAYSIAAIGIANKIKKIGCTTAAIVPIPSSDHIDPGANFTGKKLAEVIQQKIPTMQSRPELYFAEAMAKSAEGGGRDVQVILENLRASELNGITSAVLVDDVYTTGAHMRAAARYLRNNGIEVKHAFVVARTAWLKPEDMFNVISEEIHYV